jgi:hypothetical protein
MTVTLSKAQIEALKVELGKYGLDVRAITKPRKAKATDELAERIARVQAMSFKTAGVKASIIRTLKLRQKIDQLGGRGINSYLRAAFCCKSNHPAEIAAHWANTADGHLRRETPSLPMLGYRKHETLTIHERA